MMQIALFTILETHMKPIWDYKTTQDMNRRQQQKDDATKLVSLGIIGMVITWGVMMLWYHPKYNWMNLFQ
jgi:hypothetical protein